MKTKPVKAAPMARVMYMGDKMRPFSDTKKCLVLDWSDAGQAALREKIHAVVKANYVAGTFSITGTARDILAALAPAKRKGRGK